jgi:hypothetical protein
MRGVSLIIFHKKQIEKPIDSPFGFLGVHVCTKLLHYGDFPMCYSYQILGLVEKSEGWLSNVQQNVPLSCREQIPPSIVL